MIIISGALAREPELKKVKAEGRKRYVLHNCVFVNIGDKKSVPVNITAWDKNATYIADNFSKGEQINLVAGEKLDSIHIDSKRYGVCTFTVMRIVDRKVYKAITGILSALITRIINCSDEEAEAVLNLELLEDDEISDDEISEEEISVEGGDTEKEKADDIEEPEMDSASPEALPEDAAAEDIPEDAAAEDIPEDVAAEDIPEDAAAEDIPEDVAAEDIPEDVAGDGPEGEIEQSAEEEKAEDRRQASEVSEYVEDDPEDEWIPQREPSNYYVLDFSYVKKENYHQ